MALALMSTVFTVVATADQAEARVFRLYADCQGSVTSGDCYVDACFNSPPNEACLFAD